MKQQKDEITYDKLKTAALVIFGLPCDKFSMAEVCLVINLAYLTTTSFFGMGLKVLAF